MKSSTILKGSFGVARLLIGLQKSMSSLTVASSAQRRKLPSDEHHYNQSLCQTVLKTLFVSHLLSQLFF
jgi:hypothetical protein